MLKTYQRKQTKKQKTRTEKNCWPIVLRRTHTNGEQPHANYAHEKKSSSVKCSREKLTTFNLAGFMKYGRKNEEKWPYSTFLFPIYISTHETINFWFMEFKVGDKEQSIDKPFFPKIQAEFWLQLIIRWKKQQWAPENVCIVFVGARKDKIKTT